MDVCCFVEVVVVDVVEENNDVISPRKYLFDLLVVETMEEASILLADGHEMWRFPRRHHIHVVPVKADIYGGFFGLALDGTQQQLPTIIAPVG
jgi:hypothetical protein